MPRGHYARTARSVITRPDDEPEALGAEPEEAETLRSSPRPEMRQAATKDDGSRDRAAKRAAQIMGHMDFSLEDFHDDFNIGNIEPDGWVYEWKTESINGKEEPLYATELTRKGWETVPAERHPHLMPKGSEGAIRRKGMVLMEIPKEIHNRYRAKLSREAFNQVNGVREKVGEAPPGTMQRSNPGGDTLVKVKREYAYEPLEIPKDQ